MRRQGHIFVLIQSLFALSSGFRSEAGFYVELWLLKKYLLPRLPVAPTRPPTTE